MKKSELTSFGKRIRELRMQLDMTMDELGETLGGVKKTIISLWENDKNLPTLESFMKICLFFKCDPFWLYTGNINPKFKIKSIPPNKTYVKAMMDSIIRLEKIANKLEKKFTIKR